MKLRPNRRIEREAVNATRSFFEANDYVCQEIDLANDYGKDLYLDVTDGNMVTGLCIAIQVKGGKSFRRKDHYRIPVDIDHERIWRESSLPIAGIVYDADDQQLRWCNISRLLETSERESLKSIRIESANILNSDTLRSAFTADFKEFTNLRSIGQASLNLVRSDFQRQALSDCFVLGRADARVLTLIRELLHLFEDETLHLAIAILGHATPHPDIFWHKGNWIPESTCREVCKRFRWSIEEIIRILKLVECDEWQRGGMGQMVYSLLCVDPAIEEKIDQVADVFLMRNDDENAFWCMYLSIYWANDRGMAKFEQFLERDERFGTLPLVAEMLLGLEKYGYVTLFE